MKIKTVAIYCGSSKGNDPVYKIQSEKLVELLANKSIKIIYGGGNIGLMKIIADKAVEMNARITGVIPEFMKQKELAHTLVHEIQYVATMHERKMVMHELSDAVIALPGGFGTMDEVFEMLTWSQLGLHQKPVGFLNIHNYFDHLISFIKIMHSEGFLSQKHLNLFIHAGTPDILMKKLENFIPNDKTKWLEDYGRT